jgi:hypothetical protein
MSKESEETAIETILENFKFELVYAYMKMVGWTYFDSPETPTIKRMEKTARELLTKCKKKNGSSVRSGGFEASCTNDECSGLTLILSFIPLETIAYLTEQP